MLPNLAAKNILKNIPNMAAFYLKHVKNYQFGSKKKKKQPKLVAIKRLPIWVLYLTGKQTIMT